MKNSIMSILNSKKYFISLILILIFLTSILTYPFSETYKVHITRKTQDLYKVENSSIWIKTKYCYEYSYNQEALLLYSGYGFSKGKLKFKSETEYDIEEVFEGVEAKAGTYALSKSGNLEKIEIILVPTTLN